ncbi:MAG: hypothetical protein KJ964_07055 [Verrucomicrobia bacterium]|nr:hypothetical protein [Verrucomicrobiota bacterium]MBU1733959.1 hypothetical protein [Verrucomicrobiota bacterium]MBU1856809.1 hypothetical protein [Verrucomicrobiota bacterium]
MWHWFDHPGFSLPVVRRRLGEELLDLVQMTAKLLATQGRSFMWNRSFPSTLAYDGARRRLYKAGLVAYRRGAGKEPVLRLTAKGERATDDIFRPERWWQRRWPGIWYLMVYDIPETQRSYRNVLRHFLRRLRIGRLQGSVWITPRDIRPEYDDLVKAAGIKSYAYLFEARTVLGLPTEQVVRSAWPTDLLEQCQQWYCENARRNWDALRLKQLPQKSLWACARETNRAFRAVMALDPLLPKALWPDGYRGAEVIAWHRRLLGELAGQLE